MATEVRPLPYVDVHETNVIAAPRRRVAWGAIIAGAIIALIIQLGLNMLGFSIGVNSINPATEANPIDAGLGTTAVIWFTASGLIAFFTGGYVAGRMAGMAEPFEGVMHGILAWAVAGIVSLLMLSTSVGNIINTVTGAIGQGIAVAGQSLSEVSPEVAQALDLQDISLQTILEEARTSLRQTAAADVEPAAPADEGEETAAIVEDTAADILRQPDTAQRELESAISRLLFMGETITEEDREAVVQVIVNRTELTDVEAREALARWEQTFAEVRANAEETARQAGQAVADSLAAIAGAIFAAMVVGAFAAGAGGWVGAPDDENVLVTRTTS